VYTEKPSRSQEGIVFARTNHGRVLQYTGVTRIPTRRRCDEICHLCTYDTDCCIIYSALGEDGSYLLQLVHRITTSYRGYTWWKMRYVSQSQDMLICRLNTYMWLSHSSDLSSDFICH